MNSTKKLSHLGGKMELSISSVCWAFCDSTGGSLLPPLGGGLGTGPALVGCWGDVLRALACKKVTTITGEIDLYFSMTDVAG